MLASQALPTAVVRPTSSQAAEGHDNDKLSEIFGAKEVSDDALNGQVIAVTGTLGIFDTHAALETWLEEHGATVRKAVKRDTTHLIKGKAAIGNKMVKDPRFWKNKYSRIKELEEKDYV